MQFETQEQLELYAFGRGQARISGRIQSNEDKGRANNNPYAQAIYRRFVLPLASQIESDLQETGPARLQAHCKLLRGMDPESVAYLAVRAVLIYLMQCKDDEDNTRAIMNTVGQACYHEHLLTLFADANPELFYTLVQDMDRKDSGVSHRLKIFRMQVRAINLDFTPWPKGAKDQVGGYILEQLEVLGMLTTVKSTIADRGRPKTVMLTYLEPSVAELVDKIGTILGETSPYFLPCIEPPKPWTAFNEGGWHTKELRRMMPYSMKARATNLDHIAQADMAEDHECLNLLQGTRWRVNQEVLEAAKVIARHYDMGEIISQADFPKPRPPHWLLPEHNKDNMSAEQLNAFRDWKRSVAEWHLERKRRGTRMGRFFLAREVADQFKDYEAIHFVYQMDFRGRKYAQTTGISPQGSDLQKAMIHFSQGEPLDSEEAVMFFLLAGSGNWGYDKATWEDRVKWVQEHEDLILGVANDFVSNRGWTEADNPMQFLAWCFEYRDWKADPQGFLSHLPVGQDGSINGLQNFSAMLRDEVGGRATNLLPSEVPNDLYQMVADETTKRLPYADTKGDEGLVALRDKWLKHGISRSVCKRSAMTVAYSSTRYSSADFIRKDYLEKGKAPEFDRAEYRRAATLLSFPMWDSIGAVVVRAMQAMDWLQQCSTLIIKSGEPNISWVTPTGAVVQQSYQKRSEHRINTKLHGSTKITLKIDTDTPAANEHKSGIAPNFIHSMDAAHLTRTVLAASKAGIKDFAMIHDDFGCHARYAGTLHRIIREEFIRMYEESSPLEEFYERYKHIELPAPPAVGNLDLQEVRNSRFFFSP